MTIENPYSMRIFSLFFLVLFLLHFFFFFLARSVKVYLFFVLYHDVYVVSDISLTNVFRHRNFWDEEKGKKGTDACHKLNGAIKKERKKKFTKGVVKIMSKI